MEIEFLQMHLDDTIKAGVFIREKRRRFHHRGTQGRRPCEDGAETGVIQPQGEERLDPPEAGRDEEGLSSRAFQGRTTLLTP